MSSVLLCYSQEDILFELNVLLSFPRRPLSVVGLASTSEAVVLAFGCSNNKGTGKPGCMPCAATPGYAGRVGAPPKAPPLSWLARMRPFPATLADTPLKSRLTQQPVVWWRWRWRCDRWRGLSSGTDPDASAASNPPQTSTIPCHNTRRWIVKC